jgi:hypothetical protein
MGELILPSASGTTITNSLNPTVNITTVSGSYNLSISQGPYFNTYQISNNDQYLLAMVLSLSGTGADTGSFIVDFVGLQFDPDTTAVSCDSDIPFSGNHYCTGAITTTGPDTGKVKIAYQTNVNATIQIFIFGSQL